MMTISDAARGLARRAGLAAVAAIAVTAMSHGRVEALSLASPAAMPSAKYASEGITIEVRGGRGGGGFRGGGGGGFRGGGGFAAAVSGRLRSIAVAAIVPRASTGLRRPFVMAAATESIATPIIGPTTGGTTFPAGTSIGPLMCPTTPIRAAPSLIATSAGPSGPIMVHAGSAAVACRSVAITGATAGKRRIG